MADATLMEKLVSLCKRRGFIYPASEIYGGLNGFWDYGPLGVLLKNNIRDWWWRNMVECPPIGPDGHPIDMVGIDTAIIQHPKTWVASGHAGGFADPMVDCRETKKRYRADHLLVAHLALIGDKPDGKESAPIKEIGYLAVEADDDWLNRWHTRAQKLAKKHQGFRVGPVLAPDKFQSYDKFDAELRPRVIGPDTDQLGTLTEPRQFNLMLLSEVGAVDPVKVYLRPETAQGIFLNFKNITDTTRVKVPFGVAQVGKSFRNEVTPRNFIFRSREFEQMEMEWFCHPDEAAKWYAFWKDQRMKWWRSLGVAEANLKFRDHAQDELSHYSKMTVDIEYKYPFTAPDFGELEGIAHRGEFDLTQHAKHSGQKLDYFDQELQLKLKAEGKSDEEVRARSRYVPNVIEPASGLTRAVLVLLCEAYTEDATRPSGVYLKFLPRFAPIKLGIFPLVNKDGMPEVAEKLYLDLRKKFTCEYDPKQAIGKRYARMDEIGTPFCICIDGQTLQDQTVTIRHRDSMKQDRIALD
ncbi:MAG: glycine--tRNA ligase, partial [Tepidisphaeraceae bacterium]